MYQIQVSNYKTVPKESVYQMINLIHVYILLFETLRIICVLHIKNFFNLEKFSLSEYRATSYKQIH